MGADETRVGRDAAQDRNTTTVCETSDFSDEGSLQESVSWDPTKLSILRKIHIIIAGFTCTFNGNLGSSMPSGALDAIAEHFVVTSKVHLTLLNSLYMVGYVLGPLIFGPLSEYIGRRPVLIGTFLGYVVFMLACSGAPTFAALLIFRLLCGINAAAPTTVIGGLYADILDDPSIRGFAMAFYMTVTTIGPLIGPIISGFSSPISWRWPFWIATLISVPGMPFVLTLPETYAPVLHNKEARRRMMMKKKKKKKKKGSEAQDVELELKPFNVREIFLRPMMLLITEPILLLTSMYLTLVYAIMYLMFQAYPIVFQKHYGLSPGMAGLAYLPMVGGTILALGVFTLFTWYHDRQAKAGVKWANTEIYRRLPLACFASPCMVIALFWLGWTSWDSIAPIVPMFSGLFFTLGMQLLFMGMINYLTDVFRQNSASAHAAASTTRSVGAILLPLAASPMYSDLGIHWAPSLLGFIALAMGVIPFAFIRYGDWLARNSKAAREAFAIRD